ncbi:hypothetical protein LCGC14_0646010 [marine sediment metagenome]|uniref:Caspase family p20 domain-containing protein n=1 Tax=marine sediment metagenome TaxID=412755 RepID=A0A0F9RHB8_9ZZZZ
MKKGVPIILLIFLISTCLFSQQRSFKVVAKSNTGETVNLYKDLYALVIGVSDYQYGWPDLPNAVRDADEIGDVLSDLGFKVTRVKDPTKNELMTAFDDFIFNVGQGKDNCLVIFFAGHGHTEKLAYGEDMGYIVPRDAPNPDEDMSGFKFKAIDMHTVEAYARRIEAKHALFLFDSCFSGAIFNISRAKPPLYISYKTARPVRQFITAGGADEPVPDNSIFKRQFIEALQGEADRNEDGYVTGTELGEFLQEKVVVYSREAQHPQYGKIRDPSLDKGDFVFQLRSKPDETIQYKPDETIQYKPDETIQYKPDETKQEIGYGYLIISSYPPTEVEIDERRYRVAPPLIEIRLLAGRHTIKFFNKELRIEKTIVIELLKGERKRIHERFN